MFRRGVRSLLKFLRKFAIVFIFFSCLVNFFEEFCLLFFLRDLNFFLYVEFKFVVIVKFL